MANALDKVKKSALSLPERERLQLAGDLLQSVSEGEFAESTTDIQSAWDEEITARITDIDSGAAKGIEVKTLFRKLDEKHGW